MSPSPSGPRGKPLTRNTARSRRDALSAIERANASDLIAEHLRDVLAPRAAMVALYSPKGSEADTAAIDSYVRDYGGRVVYPRVVDHTRELEFHEVTPEQLIASRFGLREPRADWRNIVGLVEITAFVVPGLAFDRTGARIGWGLGYYDATLAAAPNALRIGIAFECQLIDQIRVEAHDVVMNWIVTETATYRIGE